MSELNDLPEDAVETYAVAPFDAPWPTDAVPTGDAPVDSALDRLATIHSLPVSEHSGTYGEIHDSLMAALDAEER